jgi:hypothetical protein
MNAKLVGWFATPLAAVGLALGVGACTMSCEDKGKLPEVEVSEGRAPKVDVDVADVDITSEKKRVDVPVVGTEERTVRVPVVGTEERTVEVPDVDITMPGEKKQAEGAAKPVEAED